MEESIPLSSLYSEIFAFIVTLGFCSLFSFLETSVTALRLFRLKEISSRTNKYKNLLHTLEQEPHQILITILIAASLVNVTASALIADIMEVVFAEIQLSSSLGFFLGIAVGTSAILIFGEVIPKNIAKVHGEKFFMSTLWITNIIYYAFYPIVTFLIKFSDIIVTLVGGTPDQTESVTSEREIRFLINYINEKGLLDTEKTEMLQSIFELGSKPVKEIMVPETDIVMLDISSSLQQGLDTFSQHQFSRLPIYELSFDNIKGMIYVKDILVQLTKEKPVTLRELIRPILFVPESMKINQLLREFRSKHFHIALVLNEYGSITGLVTLEDVLEEIVGEIRDEYEDVTEKITPLDDGGWLADASVDLETISDILHITFEPESAVTLGGFITEKLQHLPQKGERVLYKHYYFQVQRATPKRVSQVLIFAETKNPL
jgi:putative hemolysin